MIAHNRLRVTARIMLPVHICAPTEHSPRSARMSMASRQTYFLRSEVSQQALARRAMGSPLVFAGEVSPLQDTPFPPPL
jgi:hypothetical protein